jgi:hypothetical protein
VSSDTSPIMLATFSAMSPPYDATIRLSDAVAHLMVLRVIFQSERVYLFQCPPELFCNFPTPVFFGHTFVAN